jgi:hypothetical protein
MNINDLKYFEQRVNNRFGTSAAPAIDVSLLPETATDHRLKWRRLPVGDVSFFDDGSDTAQDFRSELCQNGHVLTPIHPFEVDRWPDEAFVESGAISASASYRTMFFESDAGGILSGQEIDGRALMMKMHLERPLPGIPGDRRLTRKIIEKCIALSPVLQEIMRDDPLGRCCEIIPEFLGLSNDETGVIFRRVPAFGVMPLFSLFSPDPELLDGSSHIESKFKHLYGGDASSAAAEFGDQLARPLLRPLFAGFRAGFSLEMHAQNVLFLPGESALIDRVFIRDLEGVVFSNRYRVSHGLEPLFEEYDNAALVSDYKSMTRWFNRNVDHDLGRVFTGSLDALVQAGYFSERERTIAVQSIRKVMRQCVSDACLEHLNLQGRVLPVSRSPYGNGLSKGHYYRTRYR